MTRTWRYAGDAVALPVQCCCEPGRRFGWVIVPKAALGRVHFMVEPMRSWVGWPIEPARVEQLSTVIDLHVSTPFPAAPYECPAKPGVYHDTIPLHLKRLAVSSGDYPLETWRRVKGFTEAGKRL